MNDKQENRPAPITAVLLSLYNNEMNVKTKNYFVIAIIDFRH